MDQVPAAFVKHREIGFRDLHPDPDQARSASLLLVDLPGIAELHVVTPLLLKVSYHVLEVTLEQIEGLLDEAGFHLDNRLIYRLKRALHYYTEEVERTRYRLAAHGCRDPRPEHWREYR